MKKCIVIGSGIGGLVVANLLRQKGHFVELFEKEPTLGGYTSGFYRKNFYFETGAVAIEMKKPLLSILQELHLEKKLQFTPHPIRFFYPPFDGVFSSYEDWKRALFNTFLHEHKTLNSFFIALEGFFSPIKLPLYFFLYRNTSVEQFVEKFFPKDSALYSLFTSIAFGYTGAPILLGAYLLKSFFKDLWTIKGGMKELANLLGSTFEKNGGKIFLSEGVDKIVLKEKKAIGIETKNGFYPADFVISDADYTHTYEKLLSIPAKKHSLSKSSIAVYLGLSLSNEALLNHLQSPFVFDKELSLYSPSLADASLAPKGSSSLMIHKLIDEKEAFSFFNPELCYKELKKQKEDQLISLAKSLIPSLEEHIIFKESATPYTFEKYTNNLNGATAGWCWDCKNLFYKGFFSSTITTPIANVLLTSAWSGNFGGIYAAIKAAKKCAKKI